MSNLAKKLIVGGMIVAGLGLGAHAYFQKDGKLDTNKDKWEYLTGLTLFINGLAASAYIPNKTYKIK